MSIGDWQTFQANRTETLLALCPRCLMPLERSVRWVERLDPYSEELVDVRIEGVGCPICGPVGKPVEHWPEIDELPA